MALLDGEIAENERAVVERHVRTCPHCHNEFDRFQRLNSLTDQVHFSEPREATWVYYYSGVCRKIEVGGGWALWSAGALLLVMTGSLMLFGFNNCPLAATLGVIAMMSGVALLWLSYFCNCKR